MRLFVSAGEPSGDLHGANLLRSLQALRPGIDYYGFGGERMAAAGCRLLYPLVEHAVMGVVGAVRHRDLESPTSPELYMCLQQMGGSLGKSAPADFALVIRSQGSMTPLIEAVRGSASRIDSSS